MKASNFWLAGVLVLLFGVGGFFKLSHPEKPPAPVAEETSKNPDNRLYFSSWGEGVGIQILEGLDGGGVYVFTIRRNFSDPYRQPQFKGKLTPTQVLELALYLEKADLEPDPGQGAEARQVRQDYYNFRYKQIFRNATADSAKLLHVMANAPHVREPYRQALDEEAKIEAGLKKSRGW